MKREDLIFNYEAVELKKKEAEELEKKQKELRKVYFDIFNTKNGQQVLKDLCDKSGYFLSMTNRCKDNNNVVDPLKLTYLDGRRSMFIELVNMLDFNLLTKAIENGKK